VLAGIEAVLDIIDKEFPVFSQRMWRYKKMISKCLADNGFELTNGQAPITSILVKDLEECARIAKSIHSNNILATPFVPPSVPPGENKIRLIAGANLSETTVNKALDIFCMIAEEIGLR
jgi:7-keto-8-aminopelargonate synthetase-like enzyme